MPKKFTEEFKKDAVALVTAGSSQRQVCADLGISKSALRTWVQDARFASAGMKPADDQQRKEMAGALRRIRELEQENEVLCRAAAYLSQVHITPPKWGTRSSKSLLPPTPRFGCRWR
ncbi:transposase [Dermacoccus profundi]|uniref:Transposase n=2 Tax=Dermacoccus TaxID=57495 RepID=A0A417Z0U7_9MICO|nr:hypothetical protein D1832_13985 [Dermacoccus abyssi]RYI21477.1 hypothetical protein EVU97_11595 [Dermacoccus sp. 147Ba]